MLLLLLQLTYLLLPTLAVQPNQPIKICGVPGPGAWMMYNISDGSSSVELLETYLNDNIMKPSIAFSADQIGPNGIKNNPNQAITGFNADILSQIMMRANLPNYELQLYRHYTTPLIHLRTGQCDIAFGQFTHTSFRQHCGNNTGPSSSIACRPLPATTDLLQSITSSDNPSYACCGNVGVPMFATSVGIMTTTLSEAPSIATFLLQPEVANIIALVVLAVVVAAHIVWIFERHENSDQFPTEYLDGIEYVSCNDFVLTHHNLVMKYL